MRGLIEEAKKKIETDLRDIGDSAQQKKLAPLYNDLGSIETSDGIIAVRNYEVTGCTTLTSPLRMHNRIPPR